jgi:hypothetical protein
MKYWYTQQNSPWLVGFHLNMSYGGLLELGLSLIVFGFLMIRFVREILLFYSSLQNRYKYGNPQTDAATLLRSSYSSLPN